MPTVPCLNELRSASTSRFGSEYLLCASFIQFSALTPGIAVPGRLRAVGAVLAAAVLVEQHLEDLLDREAGGDLEAVVAVRGHGRGGLGELVGVGRRPGQPGCLQQVLVPVHGHRHEAQRHRRSACRRPRPRSRPLPGNRWRQARHADHIVHGADDIAERLGRHRVLIDDGDVGQGVRRRRRVERRAQVGLDGHVDLDVGVGGVELIYQLLHEGAIRAGEAVPVGQLTLRAFRGHGVIAPPLLVPGRSSRWPPSWPLRYRWGRRRPPWCRSGPRPPRWCYVGGGRRCGGGVGRAAAGAGAVVAVASSPPQPASMMPRMLRSVSGRYCLLLRCHIAISSFECSAYDDLWARPRALDLIGLRWLSSRLIPPFGPVSRASGRGSGV